MPEVKMTEQQLNYNVNNNPMTEKRPLTECAHEAPYGPGTGREDPRAHDPKPTDGKEQWKPSNAPKHNSDQDPEHGPGME